MSHEPHRVKHLECVADRPLTDLRPQARDRQWVARTPARPVLDHAPLVRTLAPPVRTLAQTVRTSVLLLLTRLPLLHTLVQTVRTLVQALRARARGLRKAAPPVRRLAQSVLDPARQPLAAAWLLHKAAQRCQERRCAM